MKKKRNNYLKLFLSTFYLSAFTFGGGYVIVSLMKKKFVDELKWLEEEEMLNFTAIAQSSPGAVAINTSILLGYRVAGRFGALIAIVGTVLPPLIIISIISFFYAAFRDNIVVNAFLKGMQAGVAAVIADVVINLFQNILKMKDYMATSIMIVAFIATVVFGVNVMYIIIISGIFGALTSSLLNHKKKGGIEK